MNLLSTLGDFLRPRPAPEAALLTAIERIVDLVDPALRSVGGYVRQLEAPVQHALAYCSGLVDCLSEPIDITHRAFASDPLVHSLFATVADIDLLLGESEAVRDYLAEPASYGSDELYALLAARRCSKRVLGYAVHGDEVRADVPQELLYFTDHALVEPESSLESLRTALRATAFDSLGKSFRAHVDALREERSGLRSDRHQVQAHLTLLRGKTENTAFTVQTRRIGKLDASLRAGVESLMPEQILATLATSLAQPEQQLRLDPVVLAVDRIGVMLVPAQYGGGDAATLKLVELISRDQRRNVILLVRIRREDAAASVEAATARRHRFLII